MNPQKHRSFRAYLIQIGERSNLSGKQIDQILKDDFDEIEAYNYIDYAERVKVTRNEKGDITVATSLKIPNLRFHIGKLLRSAIRHGIAVVGSQGEPFKTAFFIISFLYDVFELSHIPVANEDAELFVGITVLHTTKPRQQLTVDHVFHYFSGSVPENQISKSLKKLEKICCISVKNDRTIEINESLIIISED